MHLFELAYDYFALAFIFWLIVFVIKDWEFSYTWNEYIFVKLFGYPRIEFEPILFITSILAPAFICSIYTMWTVLVLNILKVVLEI